MGQQISRDELKAKMDRRDTFWLVEALPLHNFVQGHLPGAIPLPEDQVEQVADHRLPDRDAEIIVYSESESCGASGNVARKLRALGYKSVREYAGGKTDWVDAGNTLQAGEPEMRTGQPAASSFQAADRNA